MSGGDQSLRKIVGLMTDDQIEWASTSESAFDVAKFGQQPPPDDDEDAAVSPTAKTGFSVGMVAGKEALQAELCRRFPAEKPALAAYFAAVAAVSSGVKPYAVLKLLPLWVASRLQSVLPFTRYSKQTTAQVLAACGCSQALAGALSYIWGDYGLPPRQSSFAVHALVVSHYFNGGHYPVGGPGHIVRHTVSTHARRFPSPGL